MVLPVEPDVGGPVRLFIACVRCECVQEVRRFEKYGTSQEFLSKAKVKLGLVALWFAVTAPIENRTFFFFLLGSLLSHSITFSFNHV